MTAPTVAEPRDLAADLAAADRAGARRLTPESPEWPATALADLGDDAPRELWVRGSGLLTDPAPRVAVVGARASTAYGEHVATELARDLAEHGVTVVSGGAYGIDSCAHRAALTVGAPTWVVLAGGVDRPYPMRHGPLFDRVVAGGGLLISEYPCGVAPTRERFLARNRLIAALSGATVAVEAAPRSGSLAMVDRAVDLRRPVFAVPGPITSAMSSACHALIQDRRAELLTEAGDVLAAVLPETPAT